MSDLLQTLRERPLPLAKTLGIEFTAAQKDMVEARMKVRQEICTRPDILHGGAVMALADTVGAAATVINLPPGAVHHHHREQDQFPRRHPDSHAMSGRLDATSARAPKGHAAAAPPSSVMTSRRLMLSLRPKAHPTTSFDG